MTQAQLDALSREQLMYVLCRTSAQFHKLAQENRALRRQVEQLQKSGGQPEGPQPDLDAYYQEVQAAASRYIDSACAVDAAARDRAAKLLAQSKAACRKMEDETALNCRRKIEQTKVLCDQMVSQANDSVRDKWESLKGLLARYLSLRKDLQGEMNLMGLTASGRQEGE